MKLGANKTPCLDNTSTTMLCFEYMSEKEILLKETLSPMICRSQWYREGTSNEEIPCTQPMVDLEYPTIIIS